MIVTPQPAVQTSIAVFLPILFSIKLAGITASILTPKIRTCATFAVILLPVEAKSTLQY